MKAVRIAIATAALMCAAAPALGQTCPATTPGFVVNPTSACWTVNVAEHNETDPVTGAAKVTRYDLQFFDEAADATNPATQPVQTSPLGKPAAPIGGNGVVSVALPSYPLGRRFKAVVVAVGPGGSSPREVGATSNPFGASNPPTAPRAPSGVRVTTAG